MKETQQLSLKTKVLDLIRFFFRFPLIERFLIGLKGVSHAFAKLIPNYYQYPRNSFRTFTQKGIKLKADISEWLGYCAYFNVKNDPYDALFPLVQPDMTVIDIGANIGFTALNMAAKTGTTGKVYAFEPDELNFSFLYNNVQQNKNLPVYIYQLGLGNSTEKLKLEISNESNRGENKITNNPSSKNFSVVDIIRLDDFIAEKQVAKVDLIKIDTEGFEMNVLKGAEKTITTHKPVLFIEVNDENLRQQKTTPEELVKLVSLWGYTITSAQSGQIINVNSDLKNCQIDIICKA